MLALTLVAPAAALADAETGGATPQQPLGPPGKARIVNGQAVPPSDAPPQVVAAIAAANRINGKPYRYGGGHRSFNDRGYDCSGTVSYVLHGAGLLRAPLPSGPFMRWGAAGKGRWITVYAHGGHAFIMVAGLRFDTGYRSGRAARRGVPGGRGPRWDYARPTRGFTARHPRGL